MQDEDESHNTRHGMLLFSMQLNKRYEVKHSKCLLRIKEFLSAGQWTGTVRAMAHVPHAPPSDLSF